MFAKITASIHGCVPANGQRLGEEICQVEDVGDEHDAELALVHAITEPVKPHVEGLAELGCHRPIDEPNRALVIAVDNSGRLGVPEIGEYLSLIQGDAGSGEDTGDFGLGHEGDDHRYACGMGGDGVVDGGFGVWGEKIGGVAHAHVVD